MPAQPSPQKRKTRASSRRSSQPINHNDDVHQVKDEQQTSPLPPQQQQHDALDDDDGDDHDDKSKDEEEEVLVPRISAGADDDQEHVKQVINDTRALLTTLAPPLASSRGSHDAPITAFEVPPESLSLHTIRDQLLSKSDRSKRSLFGGAGEDVSATESPSKRRRSSLSQIMVSEGELDIDWATYKHWPEGIAEEEALMLDYFRKLKFIYLEQETKMRFLADVQDDIENGTEATVYSAADVAERERTAKSLKSQLVEAKSLVRSLRAEVDAAAEELVQPWQQVEQDSKEAERLIKEIGDMELELAKIRAQSHGKGSVSAIAGREGPLTTTEAEEVCDAQVQEMTTLEDQTTTAQRAIETAKKELVSSLKLLDRMNAERSTAEKYAAEAKLGMGRDGGRDLETERLCASHSSTLSLLKSLLGLESIEAVDANQIKLVYRLPSPVAGEATATKKGGGRRKSKLVDEEKGGDSSITLLLRFEEAGGRVAGIEVLSETGEEMELGEVSASRLRALQLANDVPLMVQEVLGAF